MFCCGLCDGPEPAGFGYSQELSVQWGYHLTKGARWYMEDYHTAECRELPLGDVVGLYAIYDGHGGKQCVQFVQAHLFHTVLAHPAFKEGDVRRAMHDAYMQVDNLFGARKPRATCGCTSTTVLQQGQTLWVAHVGDSRAIRITKGAAVQLTRDHKASDAHESARIYAKGGFVTDDAAGTSVARVGGVLAVSRAFGNNHMKAHIDAEPEVDRYDVTADDEWLVLASDGVWDVLTNDAVAGMLSNAGDCKAAAERITLEAYRRGSDDNISCLVVRLNVEGASSLSQRFVSSIRNLSQRGFRKVAGGSQRGLATGDAAPGSGRMSKSQSLPDISGGARGPGPTAMRHSDSLGDLPVAHEVGGPQALPQFSVMSERPGELGTAAEGGAAGLAEGLAGQPEAAPGQGHSGSDADAGAVAAAVASS